MIKKQEPGYMYLYNINLGDKFLSFGEFEQRISDQKYYENGCVRPKRFKDLKKLYQRYLDFQTNGEY